MGMPARLGAPVVHAHAAWRAGEGRIRVGCPCDAAGGCPGEVPTSRDARGVHPSAAMPARLRIHASPHATEAVGEGKMRRPGTGCLG